MEPGSRSSFALPILPAVTLAMVGWLLLACGGGGSSGQERSVGPAGVCVENPEDGSERAEMLRLVNEIRSEERVCGDQTHAAVAPLAWSCPLEQAARGHAEDMATHGFFEHTGSDGLGATDRITASGYAWDRVRENLAGNYDTVGETIAALQASPSHCENLMFPEVEHMGMAYVLGVTGSGYRSYWSQALARPAP